MACRLCGSMRMLFDPHYGMEHNVCENCGTIVDNDQLTSNVSHKEATEIENKCLDHKDEIPRKSILFKSRSHREALDLMKTLMDGLNLPQLVRKAAYNYIEYSRFLSKVPSVGACVYLAMKDFDMPVTIRYIANFLQISHFAIGKIMVKLEKRLKNERKVTNFFDVNYLIPLIFTQAKFGEMPVGQEMHDLVLSKTEKLINLLQQCQASTGYAPHTVILAAAYLVWKNLYMHNWNSLEKCKGKISKLPYEKLSPDLFLSKMGIQLSNSRVLTDKVFVFMRLLSKLADQIPWLSLKAPSHKKIIYHLDDFLKYQSSIVDMTAHDMAKRDILEKPSQWKIKQEEIEIDDRCVEGKLIDVKTRKEDKVNPASTSNASDHLDYSNVPWLQLIETERGQVNHLKCDNGSSGPSYMSYLDSKETISNLGDDISSNLISVTQNGIKIKVLSNSEVEDSRNISAVSDLDANTEIKVETAPTDESNGYSQLLKVSHPYISVTCKRAIKRKSKEIASSSSSDADFTTSPKQQDNKINSPFFRVLDAWNQYQAKKKIIPIADVHSCEDKGREATRMVEDVQRNPLILPATTNYEYDDN